MGLAANVCYCLFLQITARKPLARRNYPTSKSPFSSREDRAPCCRFSPPRASHPPGDRAWRRRRGGRRHLPRRGWSRTFCRSWIVQRSTGSPISLSSAAFSALIHAPDHSKGYLWVRRTRRPFSLADEAGARPFAGIAERCARGRSSFASRGDATSARHRPSR